MIGLDRIKRRIIRFKLEETGTAIVEMVAYRAELISSKAALTIADMYSRETGYIDPTYLNGTRSLLKYLTLAENDPDYRVTVFFWDDADSEYKVVWSRNRGGRQNFNHARLNTVAGRLPTLSDGERAILVETWTSYQPKYGDGIGIMMGTGLEPLEFNTFVAISPRFAPTVCWNRYPDDPTKEKC